MSIETYEGVACTDCILLVANGDPPDLPEEELKNYLERVKHYCGELEVVPGGSDEEEFSWQQCDCCGTTLGGSRHQIYFIERKR